MTLILNYRCFCDCLGMKITWVLINNRATRLRIMNYAHRVIDLTCDIVFELLALSYSNAREFLRFIRINIKVVTFICLFNYLFMAQNQWLHKYLINSLSSTRLKLNSLK